MAGKRDESDGVFVRDGNGDDKDIGGSGVGGHCCDGDSRERGIGDGGQCVGNAQNDN